MRRVLFLFNHDAAHQVAHLAGVAAACARRHPAMQVVVAYGSPAIRERLDALIAPADAARIEWHELRLPRVKRALAAAFDRVLPATRLLRLRQHAALFAGMDMIVSPERTCLRLKRWLPAGRQPLFALLPHGAGDRNVSYHPDFARFDLLLVAGRKVVEQLVARGISADRIAVVGYPKFDTVDPAARPDPFGNGRPTFVYNPHFDPHLSSWYDAGPALLRWFAGPQGQAFNLIFAPHVMLFRKRLHISPEYRVARRRPDIPPEALAAPNILVDTAGPGLFDMRHMFAADAYIGDVSSQIYEFLLRPRPAFFLDCAGPARAGDMGAEMVFRHAGPVAHSLAQLTALLPDFARIGDDYREAQRRLFAHTFDIGARPANERAADAIAARLSLPD